MQAAEEPSKSDVISGFGYGGWQEESTATQASLVGGGFPVHSERPRARRYPFVAGVELTDIHSEAQIRERTSDLSLFGCHVDTLKVFETGTRVRIRIARSGAHFAALGTVVYAEPNAGMGVAFTKVEQKDQLVLEKWIDELREEEERPSQGL